MMRINHTEKGWIAKCTCGWASRPFQVPDNAFKDSKSHKCKDEK